MIAYVVLRQGNESRRTHDKIIIMIVFLYRTIKIKIEPITWDDQFQFLTVPTKRSADNLKKPVTFIEILYNTLQRSGKNFTDETVTTNNEYVQKKLLNKIF